MIFQLAKVANNGELVCDFPQYCVEMRVIADEMRLIPQLSMLRILAELRRSREADFNIFRRRINKISLNRKVEYPRQSPDIFPLKGAPMLVLDAARAHAPVKQVL